MRNILIILLIIFLVSCATTSTKTSVDHYKQSVIVFAEVVSIYTVFYDNSSKDMQKTLRVKVDPLVIDTAEVLKLWRQNLADDKKATFFQSMFDAAKQKFVSALVEYTIMNEVKNESRPNNSY